MIIIGASGIVLGSFSCSRGVSGEKKSLESVGERFGVSVMFVLLLPELVRVAVFILKNCLRGLIFFGSCSLSDELKGQSLSTKESARNFPIGMWLKS